MNAQYFILFGNCWERQSDAPQSWTATPPPKRGPQVRTLPSALPRGKKLTQPSLGLSPFVIIALLAYLPEYSFVSACSGCSMGYTDKPVFYLSTAGKGKVCPLQQERGGPRSGVPRQPSGDTCYPGGLKPTLEADLALSLLNVSEVLFHPMLG